MNALMATSPEATSRGHPPPRPRAAADGRDHLVDRLKAVMYRLPGKSWDRSMRRAISLASLPATRWLRTAHLCVLRSDLLVVVHRRGGYGGSYARTGTVPAGRWRVRRPGH